MLAENVDEPPSTRHAARRDTDDDAVVDGSLRAPWKWETLIVESAVIGGDPQRWHRRLDGLDHEYRGEDPGAKRERTPRARASIGSSAIGAICSTCAPSRCRSSTNWRRGRRRHVGRVAGPVRALAPRILRYPERVMRVIARAAADERDRAGLARRGARRHRRAAAAARERAAEVAIRTRVRRRPAAGARPDLQRGLRARPRRADVPAEAARRSDDAGRGAARAARRRISPMQEDRGQAERLLLRLAVGSRDRASVAVVSAHRDGGVASARAVVLRAGRHARDHGAHSRTTKNCRRAPRPRAAPASRGRRRWIPRVAIDDLEHDLAVLRELLGAEPAKVRGHAHYLLRLNENLKRSVTARWGRARSQWTPFDGVTRVNSNTQAMLDVAAAGTRAPIRCRRCRSSRRARTSSCSRRSTGSSRPRSPSRCRSSIH